MAHKRSVEDRQKIHPTKAHQSTMLVDSALVQGSGLALASRLSSLKPSSLDALVLLSLGADHPVLIDAVQQNQVTCPVYLSETYGILGYDEDLQRNIELLEKGRGTEYGYQGGSGGQGCLALAYSGGAVCGHNHEFPKDASTMMVIADGSKAFAKVAATAPLHYGGITKESWLVKSDGALESVPYFWVANTSKDPVGVAAFTENAGDATKSLVDKIPSSVQRSPQVGLFPCYTRGVNEYGEENVEPDAISSILADSRIYGMFAHGELGPSSYEGFIKEANSIPCTQHSHTSILSIHTKSLN